MELAAYGIPLYGENELRLPLNYASRVLEAFCRVKSGDGWLCGFTVTNTKAGAQFVQVFDARDLPADGTVPLISKSVPASDATGFLWIPPRRFEAGLIICNSSTQGTKTLGSADCLFDAQYL